MLLLAFLQFLLALFLGAERGPGSDRIAPGTEYPAKGPAIALAAPPVPGLVANGIPVPGISTSAYQGQISVITVWATWCVPCVEQLDDVVALAADPRFLLYGLVQRDQPARVAPCRLPPGRDDKELGRPEAEWLGTNRDAIARYPPAPWQRQDPARSRDRHQCHPPER